MAAKKKAAPAPKQPAKAKKARAKSKKCKTSSAPGEAERAHDWLMKRFPEEAENRTRDDIEEVLDIPDDDQISPPPSEEELEQFELRVNPELTGSKRTQFKPGQSGNPAGRPKGSRSKMAQEFFDDFYNHWTELHQNGHANGMEAIRWVFENKPDLYFKGAIQVLPQVMDVRVSEFAELTDDGLDKKITQLTKELGVALALLQPNGSMQ